MPETNPLQISSIDGGAQVAVVELAHISHILQAALAELRTIEVCVSDAYGRELILEQFPAAGAKRVLAYRTGNGTDGLTITTAGQLVFPANEARLGLQIQNTGATNSIMLYLADQPRRGVPAVLLNPNGAWSGFLGQTLWAGNVYAVAQGGPSTLVGGEF
jgi:hypothetical protein